MKKKHASINLDEWWQQERTLLVISCDVNDKQSCSQSNIIYSVELHWSCRTIRRVNLKSPHLMKRVISSDFPLGSLIHLVQKWNYVWFQTLATVEFDGRRIHCEMMKLSPTARESVQQYILRDYKDYGPRQIILKCNPASRVKKTS